LEPAASRQPLGQKFTLALRLAEPDPADNTVLVIPHSVLEVTVYVEAPGLHVEGSHRNTLAVREGEPLERRLGFELTPLTSGEHQVVFRVYPGGRRSGTQPVRMPCAVQVPPATAAVATPEVADRGAVPDPRPEVLLYVALEETPVGEQLRPYLTCPALGANEPEPLDPLPLTGRDLAALRRQVLRIAAEATRAAPGDVLAGLRMAGSALFERLLSRDHPLRKAYQRVADLARAGVAPWSWLVVSDARAVLPWELLCAPGHDFFARQFVVGHWFGRRGLPLAGEAPLGLIDLTHYQQHPGEVRRWQAALGGDNLVGVEEQAGLLSRAAARPGYYGLHVLRFADRRGPGWVTRADAPRPAESEGKALVGDQELDLNLRRPVVGLSFVADRQEAYGAGDLDLEADWVLPFLHAGASALVGPRWPVPPEADRLFQRTFQELIRLESADLGWAVWKAREQVRLAHPHRSDWLAYAYFGHPGCAPYPVGPAQAFALFEALDHGDGEPFRPGGTYRFRASYRAEAPVWYTGRLRLQEGTLPHEGVSVLVVPLTGGRQKSVFPLRAVPGADELQEVVTLTMPAEETTLPVLVRFLKGDKDELQTLLINLDIREESEP
jgi:hypothetical protein